MFEHETNIEDYDAMSSELEMILLTLFRGCTCVRVRVQYSYVVTLRELYGMELLHEYF